MLEVASVTMREDALAVALRCVPERRARYGFHLAQMGGHNMGSFFAELRRIKNTTRFGDAVLVVSRVFRTFGLG